MNYRTGGLSRQDMSMGPRSGGGYTAHDQHRAVRVMHAVLAYRAEQGLGEAAVATAADHEQFRADRGVKQDLRRMAIDDLTPDQLAVGWLNFVADHRFDRLPGVSPEVRSLFHVDRCPAVTPERRRNLP